MYKNIFPLFLCFLITPFIQAQDVDGLYKKAKKAFDKYQQSENLEKLEEAYSFIEKAVNNVDQTDNKKAAKVWMKAGEIYNEIGLENYKKYLVYNTYQPKHPDASQNAYKAYTQAIKKVDKKWDKNEAMNALLKTATFISNEGIVAYNIEKYSQAYHSFNTVLDIRSFLNENDHVSILKDEKEYHQHVFRTALSAKKADKLNDALLLFEQLEEEQYKNADVYVSLYELYLTKEQTNNAVAALEKGRKLFPKNDAIQITEINYFIANNQLNELTTKLESAIKSDPKNPALYTTLGHVHNELQKEEAQKGNFNLANNHFEQSMEYFVQALDVDGMYSPALYNLGALYYNKAAILTQEMKGMEKDRSAIGIRKLSVKQSEYRKLFDKALPYFQRAEAVDANDPATLSALKEIYNRKGDQQMSTEFENRLAKINAGEQIQKGYFE